MMPRQQHPMLVTVAFVLAAALAPSSIVKGQDQSAPRSAERPRAGVADTIRLAVGAAPLGLPRGSHDSVSGVLGAVDSLASPTLGDGGGLEAIAGRVAGARVYWPSGAPGTVPRVHLLGRTSLDRTGAPLYVLDGVPLAVPPADVDLLDLTHVEVGSGATEALWLGPLARDGVVYLGRGQPHAATRGIAITARSEVATTWVPPRPALNRSHPFLVNESGEFIDTAGNLVDRAHRVPNADWIFDTRYTGDVFDHHRIMFAPGFVSSGSATLSGAAAGARVAAAAGRDRADGVFRDGDGYTRSSLRVSARHEIGSRFGLSLTGHRAWSEWDAAESGDRLAELYAFPVDVDLGARMPDGSYVARPGDGLYGPNPLYVYSSLARPVDKDRAIIGLRARLILPRDVSLHAGFGHDAVRERSRFLSPSGSVDTLIVATTDAWSLRTVALAATAGREIGPFGARFGVGWTSSTFRDSSFSSFALLNCPPELTCTGPSSMMRLRLRQTVMSLHGSMEYRGRYQLDASLARQAGDLLPSGDDDALDHRIVVAWIPSAESWWASTSLDHLSLHIARSARTSFFSPFDRARGAAVDLAPPSGLLRPERETSHDIGVDVRAGSRAWARAAFTSATTEHALTIVPAAPPHFLFRWDNSGTLARRSATLSLGTTMLRGDWGTWSASLVADRSRVRMTDWSAGCWYPAPGEHRCDGAIVGRMYGIKWLTSHAELPGAHGSSHGAFAVNDDGLLVPVGVGGSLTNTQWGTTVTIDDQGYPWGLPIPLINDPGGSLTSLIGDANPDLSLGLSSVLRWRGFTLSAGLVGQLGGDIYDFASAYRYARRTHADLDQADKPVELRKPDVYYTIFRTGGRYNSRFVRDGTRLWLEELSVSRSFVLGSGERLGITALDLSLVGRNLGGWSRHAWVGGADATPWSSSDDLRYPRAGSVSMKISARH